MGYRGKIRDKIQQHRDLTFRAFEAVQLEIIGEPLASYTSSLISTLYCVTFCSGRLPREDGPYLVHDLIRFGDGLDDKVCRAKVKRLLDLVRLAFAEKTMTGNVPELLIRLTTWRTCNRP